MRRTPFLLAAVAALALVLAPGLADARAGGGSSFGSRGSMTWSAPPSTSTAPIRRQPMQRSMTPNSPSPGYAGGYAASGYGFGARSGFMSGLMGGLIGAGIGGLLFGHGFLRWRAGLRWVPGLPAADLPAGYAGALPDPAGSADRRQPSPVARASSPAAALPGPAPDGRRSAVSAGPPADPDRPAGLPGVRAAAAGASRRPGAGRT